MFIKRIKESNKEEDNADIERLDESMLPEVDDGEQTKIEQVGDETISFNALLGMMRVVRDDPQLLDMDEEEKKSVWPIVKRSLAKYAKRLGNNDTESFRNYFRT